MINFESLSLKFYGEREGEGREEKEREREELTEVL